MNGILELALLAVVACGAAALLFMLRGALLRPPRSVKGAELFGVIKVSGSAPALEHSVRWLRSGGAGMRIVIADDGMDSETRAVADLLARDDPNTVLCGAEEINDIFGGSLGK